MATTVKEAGTGNQAIGKVFILYGTVKAVAPDGAVRVLGPNSVIFANERIITDSDGGVSIMLDGPPPAQIDLGRMSDVLMNEDVYAGATPEVVTDASADAEKIQEAILEGKEPLELDATAAGGATGAGGMKLTTFAPDGTEVTPTSGAETTGLNLGAAGAMTEGFDVNGMPTAGEITAADLDEDGFVDKGEGEHLITTGTLPHDFGPDGPGSISFASMDGATGELGTEVVTYSWDAATNTLTASSERGEIFTVVVDPATGEYTLTLLLPVMHERGEGENDAMAGLTYTVTDGNGDTATGTLTINIIDDSPTIEGAQQAETVALSVDESYLTTGTTPDPEHATDTASFAGLFASNFGADADGGSITYALGINSPGEDGTGLVDTLTHQAVVLVMHDGTVEGHSGSGTGDLVFTISVDGDGDVTLTQMRAVMHQTSSDPDTSEPATLNAADLVTLTATITDADGDVKSATASIGEAFSFLDDGPVVTVSVLAGADDSITLTTHDADTAEREHGGDDDEETGGREHDSRPEERVYDTDTANFADVFSQSIVAKYGADGPDSAGATTWSYSLSITGTPNGGGHVDSNLSHDGHNIYLYEMDGKIVGSTEDEMGDVKVSNTVFSLEVTDAGVVTLTQYQAIDHPVSADPSPTGAPYADQLAELGPGLVGLTGTATITDGDGDTAHDSATIDLGGNIRFADDGPSVTVSIDEDEADIKLTTHDADTVEHDSDTEDRGPDSDTEGRAHDTATKDFSDVFHKVSDYGADGPGTTTWSYSLSITGQADHGKVHSGLESGGHEIYLYEVDGKIVGSTEDHAPEHATDESVVFSISVVDNGHEAGEVTLTQYQAIDHEGSDTDDYDDEFAVLGAGLVKLTGTATIEDGDGDTATSSATLDLGGNIRFADDGPSIHADDSHLDLSYQHHDNEDNQGGYSNQGGDDNQEHDNSVTADLNIKFGGDGPAERGAIHLEGHTHGGYVVDSKGHFLTSDGHKLVYEDDGHGGLKAVTADEDREDQGDQGDRGDREDQSTIFTVSVDQDHGGTYTVEVKGVLDGEERDHLEEEESGGSSGQSSPEQGDDSPGRVLTFDVTVTDGDRDIATDTFSVTLDTLIDPPEHQG